MGKAKNKSPAIAKKKITPVRLDQLTEARFVRPSTIELVFADGLRIALPISRLGMPIDKVKWSTACATTTGESMTVMTNKQEKIPIDSSTLRYFVDPEYAAKIDESIESLQPTREELAELSGPVPDWAKTEPEPAKDLWK